MAARVPDGVSSAEAFHVLYNRARITNRHLDIRFAGMPAPDYSLEHAVQRYHAHCRNHRCAEVNGKFMGIFFKTFPFLDLSAYDQKWGEGEAMKALQAARRGRLEHSDLFVDPCTYFTPEWKARTPRYQQQDLQEKFQECEELARADESVERQIKALASNQVKAAECYAFYQLQDGAQKSTRANVRCAEAAKEVDDLIKEGMLGTLVQQFSACRLSQGEQCIKESGSMSVKTAKKALDAL